MLKKNGGRFLAALVCTAFIVFSGCPNATDPKVTPETPAGPTLAEQVVDELGASFAASASGSARSARAALSEDKIAAIKAAALAKITTDGYASSDKLDQILPSMIEGVKIAVIAPDSGLSASASAVFEATAKSALTSLGKEDRKAKLSSGVKLEAAVGTITSVAVKVAVESVSEGERESIVIAVSSVSVQIVATNAVYAPVADAAVKQVFVKSMDKIVTAADADTTVQSALKSALVEGSVKGVLSGDSGLKDAAKKAMITACVDAAITAAGSDAAAVSMVVTASTKAVISTSGTGADATAATTTFVAEIAKQVTVTVQEENISMGSGSSVADVITTAVTDAGVTDATITEQIGKIVTEVQSEVAPALDAVSSVAGGKLLEAGPVTLTASVSNTAGKPPVYTWVQLETSAPSVSLSSTTAASVTLTPSASGTYTFKVTAMFQGGFKKSEAFVTFKADFTSGESGKKVAEGIANLKAKKFDEALTSFTAAYDLDRSNNEAVFWAAMLKLASISVDPDTVSLMKDRIGVANYPSTMNDVVTQTWMKPYYDSDYGMVPADTDETYLFVRGKLVTVESPVMVTDQNGTYEKYITNYIYAYNDTDNTWRNFSGAYEFVPDPAGTLYSNDFVYNGIQYTHYAYDETQKALSECPGVTNFYTSGRTLNPYSAQLLPELKPAPQWASTYLSASNVYGDGADGKISSSSYFTLLMINLISNNPDGLNSMIDKVLAGPFGERLDSVVALIDALPDSTSVEIPLDLIQSFAGSSFQAPFPITIRKAELKAMSASVQMSKSFVQLIASYNLNYPLSFAQNAFWTTDGMTTMMEAFFKQNNPVKAGFMGDRSQATRDASKATLLAAIDDMQDAVNLLLADMATEGTIAAMARGQMGAEEYAEFQAYIGEVKTGADIIKTTLRNNSPLYFNTAVMNGGSIADLVSATAKEGYIPVNLSKLYTTDILNPAKLLETTTEGLVFYTVDMASSQNGLVMKVLPPLPTSSSPLPETYGLFVKVMKARVQEVATIPEEFLGKMPTDSSGNFYVPLGSLDQVDASTYFIADWLR